MATSARPRKLGLRPQTVRVRPAGRFLVLIAKKYLVPCITARGYMMDRVWIFNSQRSGHDVTLAYFFLYFKT